jgi:ribosomal-protein-alanine N-acetyltransferase
MAIITQTPRIIVREFLPDEEALFLELLSDPLVTDYLPKRNNDENIKIFQDALADYKKGIKLARWGVFDAANGDFIGFGMLKTTEEQPSVAELGYVIHDRLKGQGIATELAKALLEYGFKKINLTQIFAVTDKANTPSQKVLVKADFIQGEDMIRNEKCLSYFQISRDAWLKNAAIFAS